MNPNGRTNRQTMPLQPKFVWLAGCLITLDCSIGWVVCLSEYKYISGVIIVRLQKLCVKREFQPQLVNTHVPLFFNFHEVWTRKPIVNTFSMNISRMLERPIFIIGLEQILKAHLSLDYMLINLPSHKHLKRAVKYTIFCTIYQGAHPKWINYLCTICVVVSLLFSLAI